jgi:hypothetical protein
VSLYLAETRPSPESKTLHLTGADVSTKEQRMMVNSATTGPGAETDCFGSRALVEEGAGTNWD